MTAPTRCSGGTHVTPPNTSSCTCGDITRVTAPTSADLPTMAEAGRRYWTDPEFSARVKLAVQIAMHDQPDDGFDLFHRDSVIAGAAMALHIADIALRADL